MEYYFLGTRDLFLYGKGDRVPNQVPVNLEIFRRLIGPAEQAAEEWTGDTILVVFCEVHGANGIGARWGDYSGVKAGAGVRTFDTATVDPGVLEWNLDRIAGWRERGGQQFEPAWVNANGMFGIKPSRT
jgi:hypothetical protein